MKSKKKKNDEGFFSGWTAVFIVIMGAFVFTLLVQMWVENSQDSGSSVSESVSSFLAEKTEPEEKEPPQPKKSQNQSSAKEVDPEKVSVSAEQKPSEAAKPLSEDDIKTALEIYNRAIEEDPKNIPAYQGRGNLYLSMGDFQKALADFNKAIDLDSKSALSYVGRAAVSFQLGDYASSLNDLNQAIKLDPNNAEAYHGRARCYQALGDGERAREEMEKANSLAAKN